MDLKLFRMLNKKGHHQLIPKVHFFHITVPQDVLLAKDSRFKANFYLFSFWFWDYVIRITHGIKTYATIETWDRKEDGDIVVTTIYTLWPAFK
jgi:hypothetical protein